MSTNEARPPRRVLPWVLIGAVLIVAVVIAVVIAVTRQPIVKDPQTGPTVSSSPATAAPTPDDVEPTGCLGGPDRDAEMVLAAQESAPHTSNGAVEVATAMVRWLFQYPSPSPADSDELSRSVIATSATAQLKDLAGGFANTPNNSGGAVADGVDYYLSTVPGVWYLESASADQVTVSVGAAYTVDGALSPQLRSSTTLDLVWDGQVWKVQAGSIARTTEELFQIGTAFTGGC